MTALPRFIAALILSCAMAPVAAQPEAEDAPQGFSLMEEGARLFLRGMMDEFQPAIDQMTLLAEELRPLVDEMGPALVDLRGQIDSIRHYQPPEILPGGDIILRRRPEAPPYVPPVTEGGDETAGSETEI